jgi:adenylate cyclase
MRLQGKAALKVYGGRMIWRGWGHAAPRLRLLSGLVLFSFALLHFINHALGLISPEAMEAIQKVRMAFWRSVPGTVLLYGAMATHIVFVVRRFTKRRTLKMPVWEAAQWALGFLIPALIIKHLIHTRIAWELFDKPSDYETILETMWPGAAVDQIALLMVVWVHSVIGLHFWLRLRQWYRRLLPVLFALAVLIPVLAVLGFIEGGRTIDERLERQAVAGSYGRTMSEADLRLLNDWGETLTGSLAFLFAGIVLYNPVRRRFNRTRNTIKVTYPGNIHVRATPGLTALEISRIHGIPHASVCGGRARCSTCRVRIDSGLETLEPPTEREKMVLDRVHADAATRLACQIRPRADITVIPLMPARETGAADIASTDDYRWGVEQPVVIMFVDMRDFTRFSEERLPFDVVFILNRYLTAMASEIERAGGRVDKFIGDGIMALFGVSGDVRRGCRDALNAAVEMGKAMADFNAGLAGQIDQPLKIGVGIHVGPAILGRVGVAGANRRDDSITALGDTVNAASRLESSSKDLGVELVVSSEVVGASGYTLAGAQTAEITVKGRNQPLKVNTVASLKGLDLKQ